VYYPALLLALLAVGSSLAAGMPPPAPNPTPNRPVPPNNSHGLPAEIDPKNVAFAGDGAGERFRKLDAAARKIAGAGWAKRTGGRYPYASWNDGSGGYSQTYAGTWEMASREKPGIPAKPNHTVSLHVTLLADRSAGGFSLHAELTPKAGFGAFVSFTTHEGKNGLFEDFTLTVLHDEFLPKRAPHFLPGLPLGPGGCWFSASRSDDRYAYFFNVSSRPAGDDGLNRKPLGKEIARYWASAESFRDAALGELDKLEANARDGIASGAAVRITTKGGPTGADVPMPVLPGSVTVPEAMKAAVLKDAIAEVERRRKLVKEHYKDMYAAATTAFPGLGEILAPPAKK
jgi:hypothetical protein